MKYFIVFVVVIVLLSSTSVFSQEYYCEVNGRVMMKTFASLDNKTIDEVNLRVIESKKINVLGIASEEGLCRENFTQGQVITVTYPKRELDISSGDIVTAVVRTNSYGGTYGLYKESDGIKVVEEIGKPHIDILSLTQDTLFLFSSFVEFSFEKITDTVIAAEIVILSLKR